MLKLSKKVKRVKELPPNDSFALYFSKKGGFELDSCFNTIKGEKKGEKKYGIYLKEKKN